MIALALCYAAIGLVQCLGSFLDWAADAEGVFDDLQSLFLTIVVATVAYMLIWPYCTAHDCRAGRLEDRDDF